MVLGNRDGVHAVISNHNLAACRQVAYKISLSLAGDDLPPRVADACENVMDEIRAIIPEIDSDNSRRATFELLEMEDDLEGIEFDEY